MHIKSLVLLSCFNSMFIEEIPFSFQMFTHSIAQVMNNELYRKIIQRKLAIARILFYWTRLPIKLYSNNTFESVRYKLVTVRNLFARPIKFIMVHYFFFIYHDLYLLYCICSMLTWMLIFFCCCLDIYFLLPSKLGLSHT